MHDLIIRLAIVFGLFTVSCTVASAGEIRSEYTKLDTDRDCSVFSSAAEGDGDWANLTCNGYRGYPVIIYYSDLRESLHYGFPPDGDLAPRWESFGGFNSTSDTIEWRIEDGDRGPKPFATIHRWTVSDINGDGEIQVLVVEKVAQPGGDGCVVGYVVATGNKGANEQAREIADEFAPILHAFMTRLRDEAEILNFPRFLSPASRRTRTFPDPGSGPA